MSSCIICGTSVDSRICDTHQEDVVFEFRGTRPGQLTPGRYYRGSVDGFAEFGVFVDVGDTVTGLLHESELDRRLENLSWEPGDTVYAQVKNVRDNGNVDLGWSIRQADADFRGHLIDDPEFDHPKLPAELETDGADGDDGSGETASVGDDGSSETASVGDDGSTGVSTGAGERGDTGAVRTRQAESAGSGVSGGSQATTVEEDAAESDGESVEEAERVTVADLEERVGDTVAIEGVVGDARQTSGPTVFELQDGTDTVDCAAFEEAGVRAYPGIGVDDVVRLVGEVRRRRGELQVETEQLEALDGDQREAVVDRMEASLMEKARPESVEPLVADGVVEELSESLREAAGVIRRAVLEDRPVVVRHSATADGYVAGAALERATLPLIREEHSATDAEYHYFDRRPLEGDVYEMDDATKDVTTMLDNRERHGETFPLCVFVAAGGTRESLDGLEFLDIYGAPRMVIDTVVEPEIESAADTVVSPTDDAAALTTVDGELDGPTATVLAANVAAHVNEDVRDDLAHLPAVSFWESPPEAYAEAAEAAGYDAETVPEVRDAVALEAYYQSYEDKRQLIADLLFAGRASDVEDGARGLASHVSEQFRDKLETAVGTAEANLDTRVVDGHELAILDTDAFTHRFDFPPETLLLDALYRRTREDVSALIGVSEDELHLRSDRAIDVRGLADRTADAVPDGAVSAGSIRSQEITFLAGERSSVLDAVVDGVADALE